MSEPCDLNVLRSTLLDLYRRDLNDSSDYLLGSEAWVRHARLIDYGAATDPGVRECLLAAAAFARRAQSHPDPAVAASYRESLDRINRALER